MAPRLGKCGNEMNTSDFLVIGGGIIGIRIASELKQKYPDSRVIVLEKEDECGYHTSGRNSGVLHAGFYYTDDTLKAKFTKEGNRSLTKYCEERKIPINRCGKLVVAQGEKDLATMDELVRRGQKNGISLQAITAKEVASIEPKALTFERALYSPTTSSVNPSEVVKSLERDAKDLGVQFHYSTHYVAYKNKTIMTHTAKYQSSYVINAAGLYADKIAKDFGFSQHYAILPFKGLYLYSNQPPGSLQTNIYPVPDLKNPFLGVHFTVTVDRRVKIGPTAIPAFWREHYNGMDNFKMAECLDILARELMLFTHDTLDFARLSLSELRKYSRKHLVALASQLAKDVSPKQFVEWGKPGIRAQLVHTKKRCLEMDFVIEGDDRSLHVLNAVSPGFTCAIPFSRFVCETIGQHLN